MPSARLSPTDQNILDAKESSAPDEQGEPGTETFDLRSGLATASRQSHSRNPGQFPEHSRVFSSITAEALGTGIGVASDPLARSRPNAIHANPAGEFPTDFEVSAMSEAALPRNWGAEPRVGTEICSPKAEVVYVSGDMPHATSAFGPVLQPALKPNGPTPSNHMPLTVKLDLRKTESDGQLSPTLNRKGGEDFEVAPAARIKVSVLDHQTHLGVAREVSPAVQIADLVAASASADHPEAGDANEIPSGGRGAAGAGPHASAARVQILRLRLEPETLGGVTIRMRLLGARLDLQLAAERPDTMRLMEKDKDLLADKLRSAGYVMDALVIRTSESPPEHVRLGIDGAPNGREQSATGSNGDPSPNDRPSTQESRRNSAAAVAEDAQDHIGGRSIGDLYL
ncbi:hypothetical protein CU048_04635 [Beijerinckiaceae bacterium]|nr:hypothetical protein CU048_04635 [Beijerinckiaceae bacterium]